MNAEYCRGCGEKNNDYAFGSLESFGTVRDRQLGLLSLVYDIALTLRESVQSADENELRQLSADFADERRFQNGPSHEERLRLGRNRSWPKAVNGYKR